MWKFVTRGLRESLECRTSCHTNVYSQSSQNGNNSLEPQKGVIWDKKFVSPRFSSFYHDFCRDSKFLNTKNKKSDNKYHAKYSWCDAFGWSSVLAVGYVVCQSLCIRRKLFEVDNTNFRKWHSNLLYNSREGSRFLKNIFLPLSANYILPVSKEPRKPENVTKVLKDNHVNVDKSYGPITAEKAFNEAVNEFVETHETIMGEIELDCGSKAIEEERYKDAIEHFVNGSKLSSAGSMFNLALCYELGLGTAIDYTKAVKYYQRAASKGHADAMYNLGVFHAQGRGGLKTNLDTARTLFTEAAKKGQVQAIKALELENCFKKQKNLENNTKYNLPTRPLDETVENIVVTNLINYKNILIDDKDNSINKPDQCIKSYKKSVNTKNSTDIFLDMLGIHERSAMPLLSIGESGP